MVGLRQTSSLHSFLDLWILASSDVALRFRPLLNTRRARHVTISVNWQQRERERKRTTGQIIDGN